MEAMTPATAPQPTAAYSTSDPPSQYLCSNAVKVYHLEVCLCTYRYFSPVSPCSFELVTQGLPLCYTTEMLAAVTVAVGAQLGPVSAAI